MASQESYLKIVNHTQYEMSITVDGTDNYDWDGNSRPDHNFNNVDISPYSSRKEREELNRWCKFAWFTMHINFSNGDNIVIRNDQRDGRKSYQRIYSLGGESIGKCVAFQNNREDLVNMFIITSKNWQKDINENKNITEINVPGTHDTCATRTFVYAKCQSLELEEQLNLGIRFTDIRCRHIDNVFTIHHGSVYEGINFGKGVRDVCLKFLKDNPSEFIIMSIKEEYDPEGNTRSFEDTLKFYLQGYENYFWLGRDFPSVKDIRGKIVLLSRYSNNSMGIDATPWGDDTTFSIGDRIRVQDVYNVPIVFDEKWTHISKLLEEAEKEKNNWLFLNFTSGTNVGSFVAPHNIAMRINEHLFEYITQRTDKRYGTIIMDFPTEPYYALIRAIISMNYKQ